MSSHDQPLDEPHERVHWSQDIQHALALQMNFTAMALLMRSEAAVENILRENNRFNNTLARLEKATQPEEVEVIQRIRVPQGEAMTTVACIPNPIWDAKKEHAKRLQQSKQDTLYWRIEEVVTQLAER